MSQETTNTQELKKDSVESALGTPADVLSEVSDAVFSSDEYKSFFAKFGIDIPEIKGSLEVPFPFRLPTEKLNMKDLNIINAFVELSNKFPAKIEVVSCRKS